MISTINGCLARSTSAPSFATRYIKMPTLQEAKKQSKTISNLRCVKDPAGRHAEALGCRNQAAEITQEVAMPTTKPVSDTLAIDHIGAAAMVDEGMQVVKAQFASATVLPQKVWETQLAMVSEILAFMGRRMQAQAEFYGKLGRCKEIAQAVDAQQDFAKGVGGAYADEAERLSILARRNMDAWTGVGAQYVSNLTDTQKAAA